MRIVSVSEDKKVEKRIAITPEIAKKYISLGFEVSINTDYGKHLGFEDSAYENLGVTVSKDENNILNTADIIIQLGLLSDNKLVNLKKGQTLIGILNPYINKEKIDNLVKKKIKRNNIQKYRLFFIRIITKNNKGSVYGHSFISSKLSRI